MRELFDTISVVKPNIKPFYRKIFYQCMDWLNNSNKNVLVLTGPRKCGKTFCLQQIASSLNVPYYNFKNIEDEGKKEEIFNSILKEMPDTYILLDEITYISGYMSRLSQFDTECADILAKGKRVRTKIIITGSCSYAIQYAVSLALSTNADIIQTSFIDFEEWLVWKRRLSGYNDKYNPTDSDFRDYVLDSKTFTGITNNIEYIKSCLEELVKSEYYSHTYIYGMIDSGTLSPEMILQVLYAFLVKLHNKSSTNTFNLLERSLLGIRTGNVVISEEIKEKEFLEKASRLIFELGVSSVTIGLNDLRNVIVFLDQIDLITITVPYNDDFDVLSFLKGKLSNIKSIADLFHNCTICVKHPIFYFNMIDEILSDISINLKESIGNNICGFALECLCKGLLSYKHCSNILRSYIYENDYGQGEIDYIDVYEGVAYEFTISTTHTIKHLNHVKDEFKPVLISGNKSNNFRGITNINYLDYLLDLSKGYYVKRILPLKW